MKAIPAVQGAADFVMHVGKEGKDICAENDGNQLTIHSREQMNEGVCEFIKDYSEMLGCGSALHPKL